MWSLWKGELLKGLWEPQYVHDFWLWFLIHLGESSQLTWSWCWTSRFWIRSSGCALSDFFTKLLFMLVKKLQLRWPGSPQGYCLELLKFASLLHWEMLVTPLGWPISLARAGVCTQHLPPKAVHELSGNNTGASPGTHGPVLHLCFGVVQFFPCRRYLL